MALLDLYGTPEISQSVFEGLKKKRQRQTAEQIAQGRQESVARGIEGTPFEALSTQAARGSEAEDLSGIESQLALEAANKQLEDRRRGEDKVFSSGESEKQRVYGAGEAEKTRGFTRAERETERSFLKSQEDERLRNERESDLSTGGLSLAARLLGRGGGGRGFDMGMGGEGGGGGGLLSQGLGLLGLGGPKTAGVGGGRLAGGLGRAAGGAGLSYLGSRAGRALGLGPSENAGRTARRGANMGQNLSMLSGLIPGVGPLASLGIGAVAPKIGETVARAGSSVSKAIKKICFGGETLVKMLDGTDKKIKDIDLGDKTLGGVVQSVRKSVSDELFIYWGILVTGSHAVKEAGKWIRVGDSSFAIKQDFQMTVYSIITDKHRVFVEHIEFADEAEEDSLFSERELEESLANLNQHNGVVQHTQRGDD